MIDVRRLQPLSKIVLALGICTVAVNALLSGLSMTPVLAWMPKRMAGTGYLEDSRIRVEQAIDEYRTEPAGADRYLGAVVGISNVREGVELRTIAESAGTQWRFLGLAGAGLGIRDVAPFGALLTGSELRPDVVVIGFGLFQLVDYRPRPQSAQPTVVDYVRHGDLRNLATMARDSVWLYTRRQDVSLGVQSSVLDLRARLFSLFGVPLSAVEARERSPWREMIRSEWPDHFSPATLREEHTFFESLGIYDLDSYATTTSGLETLVTLIEGFRSRGSKVVLVLMPEHSTLRARIPEAALDVTWRRLRQAVPDEPRTLDFRTAVPDSGFVDLGHLNAAGRAQLSAALASALRGELPMGSPLMARRAGKRTDQVVPASFSPTRN